MKKDAKLRIKVVSIRFHVSMRRCDGFKKKGASKAQVKKCRKACKTEEKLVRFLLFVVWLFVFSCWK